ncbi:MAG: RNA polymerase sigma-54 factor [Candidatus Omnitrophica bacterium CG11_big_fil_rev_8_21_14_0_20_42_13]|uniref:RNA polymerase sigma-54 factor n=1 Tax=Candidatus Ghiorseimicrobium undicola TaxID=1974746 RepID=A0A2H0M0H5_9BACT|nr:MAG: RNA polymerase sigma-54 factor [Candidatus Omnitrophica bacterium CG11_big_fil_rev_8_21_14_0_20_42_13]
MVEQAQVQRQKQQFFLSPQMQQAINILQLPFLDLRVAIEEELENNPCLEKKELDISSLPSGEAPYALKRAQDSSPVSDIPQPARQITLEEHLLRQARINFYSKKELEIAELIVGSLDVNGYLDIALTELAQRTNSDLLMVDRVLSRVQRFDPPGCACRDIRECLLVQLDVKGRRGLLEYKIIELYFDDLANRRSTALARRMKVDLADIKSAFVEIATLEPKPSRKFSGLDNVVYVVPDIVVVKEADKKYKVVANRRELPVLSINKYYKSLLAQKNVSSDEKKFIREKMQAAQNFMKSIEKRRQTIQLLAEYIVETQEGFLENGWASLRPLSVKDVAEHIGRDESTVSRAINNKYIDTPQGIFKLKELFSGSIKKENGGNGQEDELVSSVGIKERLRDIIDGENKNDPLSDEQIIELLKQEGVRLSRRTIAKYRKALKILPSYLRKE